VKTRSAPALELKGAPKRAADTSKRSKKAAPKTEEAKNPAPAPPAAKAAPEAPAAKPAPVVVSVSAPVALAEPPRKGADLAQCTACHATLTEGRKPHNPIKEGKCDSCHVANPGAVGKCQSPAGSAWKLVAEQPALCAKCHDTSGAAPPHPVIKAQGCTACHDPHASKNPTLTKIWPVEALCYKCHAKYDDAEFIHTAVKQGKCLGCHSPHAGDAKPLLLDKREALCSSCHETAELTKGAHKHAPVVEGQCLSCHDPHRSDYKAQTVEKGKRLCLACHDAKAKPGPATASLNFRVDLARKLVHKPVSGGDCQDCHTPQHSSDNAALLQKPPPDLCFKCHTRFDELYKFQHSAAKLGECAVCHDPHSSENKGLLTAGRINDVCFKCHADDASGRKWVHKPITDKGCTSCHDAHGGDFKFNLADAEGNALCLKCHAGVGAKVKVKHKALDRYGCTACHTPHAGDNPKGLLKAANALCTGCHAEQQDGGHIKTFSGKHPVAGPADPKRKGADFSCVSCHAPHGSDNPRLFYAGATPQDACKYCH
jgi:predicted CXXCH cytochrome family protein